MKRGMAVAVATCAVAAAMSSAHADISVSAGFEGFEWKESTSPTVKESGLRYAFDLTWTQSREPGPSVEYNIKTYVGTVDYTGATLATSTPISSETHYRGLQNELRAVYRTVGGVDFMLAAGWDHWTRDLSAAQKEEYDILYGRAGVGFGSRIQKGIFGNGGVKYVAYARENAHLTDLGLTTNPRLRPGRDFSLFANLGYRVSPGWDIIAYYDSYRFKQSNTVAVTDGTNLFGIFQPKSKQDQIGMKVQKNF